MHLKWRPKSLIYVILSWKTQDYPRQPWRIILDNHDVIQYNHDVTHDNHNVIQLNYGVTHDNHNVIHDNYNIIYDM